MAGNPWATRDGVLVPCGKNSPRIEVQRSGDANPDRVWFIFGLEGTPGVPVPLPLVRAAVRGHAWTDGRWRQMAPGYWTLDPDHTDFLDVEYTARLRNGDLIVAVVYHTMAGPPDPSPHGGPAVQVSAAVLGSFLGSHYPETEEGS